VEILGKFRASRLKLGGGGEAGAILRALCEDLTQSVRSGGAEDGIGSDRNVVEVPLSNPGPGLAAAEGHFEEGGVTFIVFAADFFTDQRVNQLENLRLVANTEEIDLLVEIQRGAGLDGSKFAAEQREGVGHGHTETRLRHGLNHVGVTLLTLWEERTCD